MGNVKYTLSKNSAGAIVLTGSDGSTSEVEDATGSGSSAGMNMLINETPNAASFTDTTANTLWRFAVVEITSPTYVPIYAVLTPYHMLGTHVVAVNFQLEMSRASNKTKWSLGGTAKADYVISRIRCYR